MLIRKPNWQSELSAYLDLTATARFRYGRVDCGLFVAGAIAAMTGIDVAPELRGYTDRRSALSAVKALCGESSIEAVAAWVAERAGLREGPVFSAQRGDPVLIKAGRTAWLGIVALHGTEVLSPGRCGTLRLRMSQAVRAWHI